MTINKQSFMKSIKAGVGIVAEATPRYGIVGKIGRKLGQYTKEKKEKKELLPMITKKTETKLLPKIKKSTGIPGSYKYEVIPTTGRSMEHVSTKELFNRKKK